MLCCRCSPSDFHFRDRLPRPLAIRRFASARYASSISNPINLLDATALRRERGISDAEKRIQHGSDARRSVQFDAPFGELNRKCRRMRPFFLAALNCFVGDEPRVPAATQIFSPSMRPTRDVALILIRNAKRQPVQFDATGLREMKNIFVAIVEKSRRIDRLEMAK